MAEDIESGQKSTSPKQERYERPFLGRVNKAGQEIMALLRDSSLDSQEFLALEDHVKEEEIALDKLEEPQKRFRYDPDEVEKTIEQRKKNPVYASAYEQFEAKIGEYRSATQDLIASDRKNEIYNSSIYFKVLTNEELVQFSLTRSLRGSIEEYREREKLRNLSLQWENSFSTTGSTPPRSRAAGH